MAQILFVDNGHNRACQCEINLVMSSQFHLKYQPLFVLHAMHMNTTTSLNLEELYAKIHFGSKDEELHAKIHFEPKGDTC